MFPVSEWTTLRESVKTGFLLFFFSGIVLGPFPRKGGGSSTALTTSSIVFKKTIALLDTSR